MNVPKTIIVGKSASGKDYLKKLYEKNVWYSYAVPYTTRPKRDNEKNGVDYNFVTPEEFTRMLKDNKFICHSVYNDWYYGITTEQFNTCNLFIMTT